MSAASQIGFLPLSGETGVVDTSYPVGDIRRYGAVSGGTADCTTAIRNAAASLPVNGGIVYVPAGTWKLTGQVTVSRSGTRFAGDGPASVIATSGFASPDAAIYSDSFSGVGVSDLAVQGQHAWGVYIAGSSGHRIERCLISGGTMLSSGKCGGIYIENCSDVAIDGNVLSGNGAAGVDACQDIQGNNGDLIVTNVRITNNKCVSTNVIVNLGLYNPLRCLIAGNTCTGARVFASTLGAGGYGILVYKTAGVSSASVGNCRIVDNCVFAVNGVGINNQSVPLTIIDSNVVVDACLTQTEVSLAVAGIDSESDRGIVSNNIVKNSGKNGIIISGLGNFCKVIGNHVQNPALDGIVVQGALTDILIADNLVDTVANGRLAIGAYHFSDVAHQRIVVQGNLMRTVGAAVFFTALSDGCVISNNVATGVNDPAYGALNLGTNAIVENNTANGVQIPEGTSADRGDANVTLVAYVDFQLQRFASTFTANRTVTLSTRNARNGAKFRVVRAATALGTFTLNVGGLKTIPAATAAFVDIQHDGSAWRLVGYGVL